jgi:putative heme-binding domain-containing protein
MVEPLIRDAKQGNLQLVALELYTRDLDAAGAAAFLALAADLEDGQVLAEALRRMGQIPMFPGGPFLARKLDSPEPEVRAAAIEAIGELRVREGQERLESLLGDKDVRVQRAAATAAGKLVAREATGPLLSLTGHADPGVRRAALVSLRQLEEPQAVPLAEKSLGDPQTAVAALECLADLGGPDQTAAIISAAQQTPSTDLQAAAINVFTTWLKRPATSEAQRLEFDQAIAQIQGSSGVLTHWSVAGPFPASVEHLDTYANRGGRRTLAASGVEARVVLAPKDAPLNMMWLAVTNVFLTEATEVQFLGSSSGSLHVFLDNKQIFERKESQAFRADSDRFAATLAKGDNRISVSVGSTKEPVEFHLRFRRKSATAEHERLAQAAIARSGNVERGRQVLLNLEKSQCLKCHRLGDQGERTGPELTGLGSRFSRIYIAESILEPSRTIAPSFGTLGLLLSDGRPLSGIKIAETETTITLVDNQAQKHTVNKSDIDQQKASPLSTMPEGLEKKLTEDEFVDLVALLASLKEPPP